MDSQPEDPVEIVDLGDAVEETMGEYGDGLDLSPPPFKFWYWPD